MVTAEKMRSTFPDLRNADFNRDLPFVFHKPYNGTLRAAMGSYDVVAEAVAKHPVKAAKLTSWFNLERTRGHVEKQVREVARELDYHSYRIRANENKMDRAFFKSQGDVQQVRGHIASTPLDVRHNKTKGRREARASGRQFRASEAVRYHQWHVNNLSKELAWRENQLKAVDSALRSK